MRITQKFIYRRSFSTANIPRKNGLGLIVSDEIKQAINENLPVIALESTIITHGLPYPDNLKMARRVEDTIRLHGGIPATCAFIKGIPYVGVNSKQLEHLGEEARNNKAFKVSRRDIGTTMASKACGGTTIASTMILSHLAGIRVFATGGLGGVHKLATQTMDISADLTELGRTPVSIVCAGPKSILDIGLTMEYLETQGVYVGTLRDDIYDTRVEVPGFYCRDSGIKSPYTFNDFHEAASIIYNSNEVLNLSSGNVFCIKPPKDIALSTDMIENIVKNAIDEADNSGISGKELTPFLLAKIAQGTQGRSVECNINFVLNNARAATEIAKELSIIRDQNPIERNHNDYFSTSIQDTILKSKNSNASKEVTESEIVVAGSIALDIIGKVAHSSANLNDSNPGMISSSVGGVGFNVFNSCIQSIPSIYKDKKKRPKVKFICCIADDLEGKFILQTLEERQIDVSGIRIIDTNEAHTAKYMAVHDSAGELVIGCADMNIMEDTSLAEHILTNLKEANANVFLIDCNFSSEVIQKIIDTVNIEKLETKLLVEPTSSTKANRLGVISPGIFPNNKINLITPTLKELDTIYYTMSSSGKFEDFDDWFPVIDSLGIDLAFREKLERISNSKHFIIKEWLDQGTLQKAFQMLPYYPNILIKLGYKGVLFVKLSTSANDYRSIPTSSPYAPQFSVFSCGKASKQDERSKYGVVIQYYPIPKENEDINAQNVTGAGDTFIGYLSAKLNDICVEFGNSWLDPSFAEVETEWHKWESIYKAQLASGLTIKSNQSVSSSLASLK